MHLVTNHICSKVVRRGNVFFVMCSHFNRKTYGFTPTKDIDVDDPKMFINEGGYKIVIPILRKCSYMMTNCQLHQCNFANCLQFY